MKDRCIHFTGIQNDACLKHVDYKTLAGGSEFGSALRIPCTGRTGASVQHCQHYQVPTAEEVAAYEAECDAYMDKVKTVLKVVDVWRKQLPIGKAEIIECPACNGKLHLSQSNWNGHVRAACATDGCVKWME